MIKQESYVAKISSQGQIMLPKALRSLLNVKPGGSVMLYPRNGDSIDVDSKFPIEKYFGTLGNIITNGQDAAEYIRKMRNEDDDYRKKRLSA